MGITDIPILATAVSLVVCWSLFALFCSFIHETVARTKSERGRFFRAKIIQQLRDRANEINWGYLMYTHGNMDLLTQKSNAPAAEITPKLLAQTFMQVVSNSAIVARHMPEFSQSSQLSASEANKKVLTAFQTATTKLKHSDVIQMMQTCLQQANAKAESLNGFAANSNVVIDKKSVLDALEQNITLWFEQFNTQCSLWYAAITRKRLFYLGLLLAVLLNIDSIQLFRFFLNEPESRAQVIGFYQQNEDKLRKLQQSLTDTSGNTPLDTVLLKDLSIQVKQLSKKANLPIGFAAWKTEPVYTLQPSSEKSIPLLSWAWASLLAMKLLGFLLTGFAASIGAPFWFDLLKKVNIKK